LKKENPMKIFKIAFLILALCAFIGMCTGAYHQVVSLIICLIAQACCTTPKAQQLQLIQKE